MSIFKCKMCGGTIEFEQGASVGVCDSCGTKQTLPKLDDDRRANLYDRANHFRRGNEFDKAAGIYEQILNEDNTDSEAYWSLVLCRYGIEYVEDPSTHKRVPTVNRAQFTSIFNDDNYRSALQYADGYQRSIYEEEAAVINEIQKGILAISQKEEPFDVFICYKETDSSGRRTQDSVLANDLYHQLTNEGFKVFFARITLEDKLGTAYEPYIFAALNSAKVMVVLGTKQEHFNAVWVKNEWSRYLALVKQSGGKKMLIPAYRDMDPYDLPEEFSHLQAQDMSKLGFMQDLIRGIKKIIAADEAKAVVKETVVMSSAETASLLKRAFMYLEDSDWKSADEYCERVLDKEPENAEAYLGKLLAELNVTKEELLPSLKRDFSDSKNYQKSVRFGNNRLENLNKKAIYNSAADIMNSANSEERFKEAAGIFKGLLQFEDAPAKADECLAKAEEARKESIYRSGCNTLRSDDLDELNKGISLFNDITGYKDADELAGKCKLKIEEINAESERRRLEQQREAEQRRIADEKRRKKNKKIFITISAIIVCITIAILLPTVIIPTINYNIAMSLYNNGQYIEAAETFRTLNGYKDSEEQILSCKYGEALKLVEDENYKAAIAAFEALEGYNDSESRILNCKYNEALKLSNDKDYNAAISIFETLGDYMDSKTQILDCKYDMAVSFYNDKDYNRAIEMLKVLGDYKDSAEIIRNFFSSSEYLKTLDVRDTFFFGAYEQDDELSNGKEDIEWLILDKQDDKILVISKYCIDFMAYNKGGGETTWETCTLREWLNNDFLNAAFNSEEQSRIAITRVTVDKNPQYINNPGNETNDKIFLLSVLEAEKYLTLHAMRLAELTKYAITQVNMASKEQRIQAGKVPWWLRTPGGISWTEVLDSNENNILAAAITEEGIIKNNGYFASIGNAVRPALWLDISE